MRHKLVCKITFKSGKQIQPFGIFPSREEAQNAGESILQTIQEDIDWFVVELLDTFYIRFSEVAAFGVGVYPYKEDANE